LDIKKNKLLIIKKINKLLWIIWTHSTKKNYTV
jgi:hypothetical protein